MPAVLTFPGVTPLALLFAGLCVIGLGAYTATPPTFRTTVRGTQLSQRTQMVLGQCGGITGALVVLSIGRTLGMTGIARWLPPAIAFALWLYVAIIVPRRQDVGNARRRRRLRALVPGFVGSARVALAGGDAPVTVLQRYALRSDAACRPLQVVVVASLATMQRERLRPFAALVREVRMTGCAELVDVAEALAQAESDGPRELDAALARLAHTLEAVLHDEFQRQLERRKLVQLALAALCLLVGVLGNILFVAIGGALLGQALP